MSAPLKRFGRLLVLVSPLLASCAVGPDFERPDTPEPPAYTAESTPETMTPSGGAREQRILRSEDLSAKWWALFRSSRLDEIVSRALTDNPSLAAARATLLQAEEAIAAAKGGFFPSVDGAASANRARTPGLQQGASSRTSSLYSIGGSVSYTIDVFGGIRRSVEQQAALADFQQFELAAAWLTVTANLVTQSVEIASLRAQIEATEEVIAQDEQNLALVQRKLDAGKVARSDLLVAATQLDGDRVRLPALRQQLSTARHAVTVLVGQVPAFWTPPDFDLDEFELPGELPLSLPSELARQRPDVLAAEAQLHAASAAIGVATAQLYPSLTLSASATEQALDLGALSGGTGTAVALGAGLTAPIFHGGTLRAERRAALDAYDAALAGYEETVLVAFQQVTDALRALEHDAEAVGAAQNLLDTARESLALQRISYEAGKSNLLTLLVAQRAYQEARTGFAQVQGQRLQDTALLFVSLGGGWWQSDPDAP